ncbi:MAG: 3-oxoacyl-ACP reductase FabG [Candidatus Obscuribacterales bacterium]|nr:3-oxoacyl-ACP reductase FabG [Steroidobacteraceae bacterium]
MLKGKTAIVTGAARGIGAAIATTFASHGANVVLNSRSESDALRETTAAIERINAKALVSVGDVSDEAYAREMVASTVAKFGGVDILVNNAGVIRDSQLALMKQQEWNEVIGVNLGGAFNCSKAVIREMMKKRWGRIVNVSSITALGGRSGQTNYGAAKAGLIGLTKSLAREVAPFNILVNAAVVGVIDTRMTRQIPRDALAEISEAVPLGRIGRPDEVASVCLFLASEMSSYVTGTALNVSGGGYI